MSGTRREPRADAGGSDAAGGVPALRIVREANRWRLLAGSGELELCDSGELFEVGGAARRRGRRRVEPQLRQGPELEYPISLAQLRKAERFFLALSRRRPRPPGPDRDERIPHHVLPRRGRRGERTG